MPLKHSRLITLPTRSPGKAEKYKLDKNNIIQDLTKDLPQYILSAYGPGRDAPRQLFGGPNREQSFEELRVRHYELAAQGQIQQAVGEADSLFQNAKQQIDTTLKDVDGAIKYICDGEGQQSNGSNSNMGTGQSPFQQRGPSNNSAWSHGSSTTTFGGPPPGSSPFSQATSGPSQPSSAFGVPSALGQPTSSFGAPSQIALTVSQPSNSGFSNTGPPPASNFAQTSTPGPFGVPAAPTSTFGQPSRLGNSEQPSAPISSFGQPSGLGQSSNATSSHFGQPSRPAGFGHPSPFGQNQPQQAPASQNQLSNKSISTNMGGSHFGSSDPSQNGPFAAASAGQPQPPVANTSSPFSKPNPPSEAGIFGRGPSSNGNAFGPPPSSQQTQAPLAPNPFTSTANASAPLRTSASSVSGGQAVKDASGKMASWNGMAVQYFEDNPCYRDPGSRDWKRIWFPDGPPTFNKPSDLPLEEYDDATKQNYEFMNAHGVFKDGVMPLVPPRKEWCGWNL